ncbi:CPBP family intramembrane metalloprotease [Myxococcota bacterium]|nr:CPBP family intramembrane metalloprotease [Myxococcota bacterium]
MSLVSRAAPVFSALFGAPPEAPASPASAGFVSFVGLVSFVAFFFGEEQGIRGDPLVYGAWRAVVHGAVPLAAAALYEALVARRERLLAGLGALLVTACLLARVLAPTELRARPELWGPAALLGVAAGAAALFRLGAHSAWGFGLGDWRFWLGRAGAAIAVIVPSAVALVASTPSLAEFYPTYKPARTSSAALAEQMAGIGLDFVGWELLFRGFILHGLARRDPILAIWAQAIPFAILHFDRPQVESLLSLLGGLLAGWFCLRARSFWPLFFIHWAQMIAVASAGFVW